VAVGPGDRWHLGSCTKAMTATLAAMLVKEGLLRWEMTLPEALPALAESMKPGFRQVTLMDLLRMRGGVSANPPPAAWSRAWAMQGTPTEQRRAFCAAVLGEQEPAPFGGYLYSNSSYALIGLICEEATGRGYEELVAERLAKPLGLRSLGFGAPGAPPRPGSEEADDAAPCAPRQPCGHRADGSPVTPGPHADNPPAIAPAGGAHLSLRDWGTFARAHLRGPAEGIPALGLDAADVQRLHDPGEGRGIRYAGGWVQRAHPLLGRESPLLVHSGSNTMWFADATLIPERNTLILVTCNSGSEPAQKAVRAVATELLQSMGR